MHDRFTQRAPFTNRTIETFELDCSWLSGDRPFRARFVAFALGCLAWTAIASAQYAPFGEQPENFDIRLSTEKTAAQALEARRALRGATPASLVAHSDLLESALADLSSRVPSLTVERSIETGAPEIVGTRGFSRLSPPSEDPTEAIARRFVERNSLVYGLSPTQAATLDLDADYTNPAGNISWVRLKQRLHGLPVFRGELTVAMTKEREILRTMGQLAVAVPEELALPEPKLGPAEAIAVAADLLGLSVGADSLTLHSEDALAHSSVFERGPFSQETKIDLVWFPLGPGVVELAWSMTLWGEIDAYYMLVSAEDGLLLFNKNITEYQTQSAKYNVYRNQDAFIDVADSPAPLVPGPTDPSSTAQGSILTRQNVVLIGNEAPMSFNNNGWITDGGDRTDGNNVQAGLDIAAPDGIDPGGEAIEDTPASRAFTSLWNPAPGNPAPGEEPTTAAAQRGAVIQLFYIVNRWHDVMYELGFTEQAFNFQHDNFGRGGAAGDRISAEAQDSSGTNNANMSTPADGGRGRMQMYRWTLDSPGRDGSADAGIVIHELTHGLSNRLHGNSSGLGSNMSRGMGEGWSDFYAHVLLSEPGHPTNGTYVTGGYSTKGILGGLNNNYYGIRRFPKAVMSFTGGTSNLPHNPITFADIDQTQVDYSDGAFPAPAAGHLSSTADQVHTAGEVWSAALWEVRNLMVTRLGFIAGNQRVLQVVTDGMKLAPVNPTFIQERDAIIAAASAFGSADVADVREGFRIRGMGFSATVDIAGTGGGTARVTEAFDYPNVQIADPITFENFTCSDPAQTPIPGDTVAVSVPVSNLTGSTMTHVRVTIAGTNTTHYGNISDGTTVSMGLLYTIPPSASCGTEIPLSLEVASDAGTQIPETFMLPVGIAPTTIATYENTTLINVPSAGMTSGQANPYPSTITVSGIADPVVGAIVTLDQVNHTWVADIDVLLESPSGEKLVVMSDAFNSSNRSGTVVSTLELRDDAAAEMPSTGVPPASGTFKPTNHGTTDTFDPPAPAGPYNHPGPGGSATFEAIFSDPGTFDTNGVWKLWIDDDASGDPGTIDGGWKLGILTAQPVECPTCGAAYCTPTLDVSDRTINASLAIDACLDLTAGDFTVLNPNGDVTFRAGQSISLENGFEVKAGAEFSAAIDPALLP